MFRNLRFYRLTSPWPKTEEKLAEVLSENTFSPCSAFSERSAGWEAPGISDKETLCRRLNGADLLQLRTQSRVLPVAAINEAMEEKVADYRARMDQDPPRSELKRIKEETKDELLPKALLKSERSRACFIHSESLLAIDVSTISKAEWFIDQLRTCFGQFACVPVTYNNAPGDLMQRIFLGESPLGFSLGHECRMQDIKETQSVATWRNVELSDQSIHHHVLEGMKLTQLGVNFDEVLTCVINEDAEISKLKFVEGEAIDTSDSEDPQSRQDADFVLLTGAIRRLNEDFKKLLGGYAGEE
jgi:recombination associated protein RdgC